MQEKVSKIVKEECQKVEALKTITMKAVNY